MKIGHSRFPSGLTHEYHVYDAIGGSKGISDVFWYGKEGAYEVIVMEYLGTSLDVILDQLQIDERSTFLYATQMVCLLYKANKKT